MAITLLTLIASFVGTLTGFGSSTIMVSFLLLFYPLAPTLMLAGIIHWTLNVWKMTLFRKGFSWRLILLFGLPGLVSTFIGARLVFSLPENLLPQILGLFLIAYTLLLFFNPAFKFSQNFLTATTGGAVSGFFAGIFGLGGAIRSAFLTTYNLPKTVYIATSGAIGLTIDSVRLITYVSEGAKLPNPLLWGLFLFIPGSFLGARFAKNTVDKIPQKKFRPVVALFLFLVGLKLLVIP